MPVTDSRAAKSRYRCRRAANVHVRRFFFVTAGAGAMSKELSRRSLALNDISVWDTEEVLKLLQKNGLEECCKAITKRQIDGDELLHLTDGKLALWKNDLTRPLIGKLWAFVQQLNKTPEKYLLDKNAEQQDDHSNDSDSWGTDFEDEIPEEHSQVEDTQRTEVVKPSLMKSRQVFQQNNNVRMPARMPQLKKTVQPEEEETYANFDSCQDEEESMYQNFQETKPSLTKNISRLHNQISTAMENATEESKRRSNLLAQKPVVGPKPEALSTRKIMMITDKEFPPKSFLHNRPKINQCVPKEIQKRMVVPPPPEPKRSKDYSSVEVKKPEKELPKPPATIRNFDLVANLPARTEESEDEYETFEENIIEQPQRKEITRVDSKLSLHSGRQGSVESVYKPPSAASYEEEEEEYEIYECITEMPEDNGYLSPIQRINNAQAPPPLPAKPSLTPPPTPLNQRLRSEKLKERSPEKKSATLPHSGSNVSLSNDRATRPLPPPPERHSYVDKPWFHNVTREQANALIKERTYNNPQDGYFLLRPSITNLGNPLALVLWYKDRVYNVPVRKRSDNRYALGSAKMNEQSFSTVEEIVAFYMREELVLHTGGMQTGSTKLTDTPPK
ncbi:lymphocyte cytosolic protein 2 isoform X2 [Harpegnathos saltator]|uniref:lymphocyte cytosolic protein 2 isoform X2 n=1 Tax=Harpegnathos saltator TaxID=610380 RepID=UPI000DBEEF9F|nr:lymphocyte cytosolic protein 2 isoform X2 [Harpegnathos saltator]